MSYIEREALLKSLESKRLIFEESTSVDEAIAEQVSVFVETIEEAPPVDVVEVVRCKECKHWDGFGSRGKCESPTNGLYCEYTYEDDYCSYGAKKT